MLKADREEPRFGGSPSEILEIPIGLQINTFKERSVATSRWQLNLPTRDGPTTYLRVSELDDIEIFFYHYASDRE